MPPKSKFSMDTCFNLVQPPTNFRSWSALSSSGTCVSSGTGQSSASPATTGPSSSSGPSSIFTQATPSPQAASPLITPAQASTSVPAQVPGLASPQSPVDDRPADPMDCREDYDGFGTTGSPQAAWVYQQIIYPALCCTYGGVDPSAVPAWAHYPAPFVVPVAFLQQQQQHQQAQQQQQAAVAAFAQSFFSAARANAAASNTSSASYRTRY